MKLLLDTHTFIWWDSQPSKLPAVVVNAIQDPATTVLLSVASVWEIVIKQQLGKLLLHAPLEDILSQQKANGLQILELSLDHVLTVQM